MLNLENLRSIVLPEPEYRLIITGKENVHMRAQITNYIGLLMSFCEVIINTIKTEKAFLVEKILI